MSQEPDQSQDHLSPAERADRVCRKLADQIKHARQVLNEYRAAMAGEASNDDRRHG
jgi:hypothetical protein